MKIFKYTLEIVPYQTINIPCVNDKILSVQMQNGKICMWIPVLPGSDPTPHTFILVGTGDNVPEGDSVHYVGTVQVDEFVFHIFNVQEKIIMKYFFDTEFIEDGKTIDLISIGIVRESGGSIYCISNEFDESKASDWVKENVLTKLGNQKRYSREEIKTDILNFIGENKPEFWAYYADYDWVVFCQLFGTMMELPKGYPMYCNDLKQLCNSLGNPDLGSCDAHNALEDASWCFEAYKKLTNQEQLGDFH